MFNLNKNNRPLLSLSESKKKSIRYIKTLKDLKYQVIGFVIDIYFYILNSSLGLCLIRSNLNSL